MLPSLELYGPTAYGSSWVPLAIGALVLAALLPALGWFLTRPRRPRPVSPPSPRDVRADALARIEQVRQAHAAGRLSDRVAHQQLGQVVRGFVAQTIGGDVDAMTLDDLRAAVARDPRLAPVAAFTEALYPPAFAPDAQRAVQQSLADAYQVVSTWS